MTSSNQLLLARANKDIRRVVEPIVFQHPLTVVQSGAALYLEDQGCVTNLSELLDSEVCEDSTRGLLSAWNCSSEKFWSDLDDLLNLWREGGSSWRISAIGYWLAAVCHRGMTDIQTIKLTRFLSEPVSLLQSSSSLPSVRRYPTGGVSEKQAVLLPAVLRVLAEEIDFCSSFLIARRLGHTGGTRDKLSVLPGFSPFKFSEMTGWTGDGAPVRYFTADSSFCRRDEALYFIRGETGTVAELGLMASSILAKQLAYPASRILIDVLYGTGAFLSSSEQAYSFAKVAADVAHEVGLNVLFELRGTDLVKWRSVGNVTEIVEAVELLEHDSKNANLSVPSASELMVAEGFARRLLESLGYSSQEVRMAIRSAWANGKMQLGLRTLWQEHGVVIEYLDDIAQKGIQATILKDLHQKSLYAAQGGILWCEDLELLADLVGVCLNNYPDAEPLPKSNRSGGIVLDVPLGDRIEAGEAKVTVYSDSPQFVYFLDKFDRILRVEE